MSLMAVYLREGRTEKIAPHYAELDSRLLESLYGVVGLFVRRSHDIAEDIELREKILEVFKKGVDDLSSHSGFAGIRFAQLLSERIKNAVCMLAQILTAVPWDAPAELSFLEDVFALCSLECLAVSSRSLPLSVPSF